MPKLLTLMHTILETQYTKQNKEPGTSEAAEVRSPMQLALLLAKEVI